ncbi:MAG: bidirectional hydrogenase complex protein HoxU, partial [Cyanobacteriota bacterium]
MSVCTLRINDPDLAVPLGTTLLQAARQAGIHIPTLCFL